jgi:hypothetical protein
MAMISDVHIPRGKRKALQATQQYASADDVDLPCDIGATGIPVAGTASITAPAGTGDFGVNPGTGVYKVTAATSTTANLVANAICGTAASKQYTDASCAVGKMGLASAVATGSCMPARIGGRGALMDGCDEVVLTSLAVANLGNGLGGRVFPSIQNGVDRTGTAVNACDAEVAGGRKSVRMIIPLSLSSICGVLAVDQKAWPGFAFCPLEIRVTLDPYAFVAFATTGSRAYKVENDAALIYKSLEVDETFRSDVQAFTMKNGLSIHALQYNCTLFQPPRGSTHANVTLTKYYQSLRSILFGFFPLGHTTNPSLRKMNRVSNCLTELQLQCGSSFFPCQPIRGNSGNSHITFEEAGSIPKPTSNTSASTIAPFLHALYSSYSNFASLSLDGILTPANCCYNGRHRPGLGYATDVTYGGVAQYTGSSSPWVCGRMTYAIDTSTSTDNPSIASDNTICGLDTTNGNNPVVLRYASVQPPLDADKLDLELRLYQLYDVVVYCNPLRQVGVNM